MIRVYIDRAQTAARPGFRFAVDIVFSRSFPRPKRSSVLITNGLNDYSEDGTHIEISTRPSHNRHVLFLPITPITHFYVTTYHYENQKVIGYKYSPDTIFVLCLKNLNFLQPRN